MAKSVNRSIRIFVNGKEVEHSLNSVRKEMLRLSKEVNSLEKGSEEYVRKSAEYRKVAGYFREIKQEITGLPTMFDRISKNAAGFVAILTGGFAITSLVGKFRQLITLSAELADKQSDVQKTTGMTKKEIRELTQELDKLNTRTSRVDLLSIAEEGGRIGIAKDDIAEFSEAMDKANVALGDVFGSASEVASTLGKLKFMFKETSDMGVSEAYNAIGSALNELGANGIASEQNIAAFATKVGALPPAFKPTIADALALGAAFEESGVNAEVAGRSYSILIQQAATNIDKFAKQMNMTTEEAEKLINSNPTEFFLQFTNSFKGMESNGTKMAGILKELGINANGVNMIIGAGANGNDRFRESLELSNKAMEEGTSMTDEFNIKNENLAANLEKIQKTSVSFFASDGLISFLETAVRWFAIFIGATEDSDGSVVKWRDRLVVLAKIIAVVTAAIITNVGWMKLVVLWQGRATKGNFLYTAGLKANVIATNFAMVAAQLYAGVIMLVQGNVKGATQAFRVMAATMKTTPWGLVIGVVSAIAVAYIAFSKEAEKAATKQDYLNKALAKGREEVAGTAEKIKAFQKIAEDETASLDARRKAVVELNKIVPDYNKNIDLSSDALKKGKKVLDTYIESLQKQAEVQFLTDQISEKSKELQKKKNESAVDQMSVVELIWINLKNLGDVSASTADAMVSAEEKKQKAVEKTTQELEAAKAALTEYLNTPGGNGETNVDDDDDEPTGPDNTELSRRQKTAEEILKLERDTNRRLRDEKLKNREEEATLMQEGWDQDLELLRIKKEKRLNALSDELEDLEILRQEYQKKANDEASKGNKAGAAGFRAQAAELQKIADEKNKTYLYVEQTFQFDLERLKLEHFKKEQEKHQKQYNRELRNLETKHNNELKAVTDLEEAKEVLRDQYGFSDEELDKVKNFEKAKSDIILAQQQETYKLQSEQLQGQIEEIKNTLAVDDALGATIFGKMMDEEQREQLMEFLEELENRLSNLNNPEGGGDEADEEKKVMGFIDLFGFSGDQWDQAFSNLDTMSGKLQLAQMGVQAMMNAWNMYYQMQRQNMQRDLDQFTANTTRKKTELKKQLDEGYISQSSYNAQVEKLDADLEKKRAEMEYKSAMTEWKMSMMQAATNTALGITAALSLGVPGIVMAVIVGAMGALQIGMIAANKPKKPEGYFTGGESGGAGRYDHLGRELADGPLHAREYVIPEWLRKDPQIAQMEEFIEARRRGRSPVDTTIGYAAGGETRPANPASSAETVTNSFPSEVLPVLNRLADVLEYLGDNPIEAKLTRSMEVAKHISDDMDDYKNHRIKNKR